MPSKNKVVIATAGSGKTTGIARKACAYTNGRSALITYTRNGSEELREKVLNEHEFVPAGMEVGTWFTFLLRHFVRPYQRILHDEKLIRRLAFVNGQSARYIRQDNTRHFYFRSPDEIYSDKISQFACAVIKNTDGAPIARIEGIFAKLFIDEIQDIAGYDLELVDHLLRSKVALTMVGDIRQGTYRTNNSAKNRKYAGANILGKFADWEKLKLVECVFETVSYRCVQEICDLADQFYPDLPHAVSQNTCTTDHDGVFALPASAIAEYMGRFNPQPLRLDSKTKVDHGNPINFGAVKGKSFERVLIYPHKGLLSVLKTGDIKKLGDAKSTIAKVYVAITRARQSVAFVVPDEFLPANLPIYKAEQ